MQELITKENVIELIKRCSKDPSMVGRTIKGCMYGINYFTFNDATRRISYRDKSYNQVWNNPNKLSFDDSEKDTFTGNIHYFNIFFESTPPIKIEFPMRYKETVTYIPATLNGWRKKKTEVTKHTMEYTFGIQLTLGSFKFDISRAELDELNTMIAADKVDRQQEYESNNIIERFKKYNII